MGDEYSIVAQKVYRALVEASLEYVCSFSEIKVFGKRKLYLDVRAAKRELRLFAEKVSFLLKIYYLLLHLLREESVDADVCCG